jgi:hypothetical protein
MTNEEFLAAFDQLFGGRRDTYARGRPKDNDPTKYAWPRVEAPLTAAVLLRHLKGDEAVGIYPIVEGKVNWAAVDFDAPRDEDKNILPDGAEIAFESAKEQMRALEAAGLQCHLERSRSGNGYHLWMFFAEWLDAAMVRQAIEPRLLFDAKQDGMDRLYPVQASVDTLGKQLGNLLALPFFGTALAQGNSVFVDASGTPIPPRTFMANVYVNASAVVEALAASAPKPKTQPGKSLPVLQVGGLERPAELLTGALKVISPYGCKFMRHAWTHRRTLGEEEWYTAIGQTTYFQHGREFAHAISRDYKGYNPKEVDAKFDHAMGNPARGCAYIHEKFPQLACAGCPMKAPYHKAKTPLVDLMRSSATPMERVGSFADDLKLVRDMNSGKAQSGYSWCLPGMDNITRLRPSELNVVGGWPSIGKTHLMTDATYSAAHNYVFNKGRGFIPFVYSLETSRTPLRQRLLARAGKVDLTKLRGEHPVGMDKQDWARLELAAEELEHLPIFHDYTILDAEAVLAQLERTLLGQMIPLDSPYALFYDYLQFAPRGAGEDSDREHISRAIQEFKFISKVLEHPSVVFSQLRRTTEGDAEPSMNWFADSSAIERNMDVGIVVTGERIAGSYAPRKLHFVKQREGRANEAVDFVLMQSHGEWRAPDVSAAQNTDSLMGPLGE